MAAVQRRQDTNGGTARGAGSGTGTGEAGAGGGARPSRPRGKAVGLRVLVGSGDKIGLLTLPFLIVGVTLNALNPPFFSVGGPSAAVALISLVVLALGIANWLWSVILILTKVPRQELITSGPYSIVKHPLYAGVALLVLPWIGVLADSWLGFVIGLVMYLAARRWSVEEEAALARAFGAAWDDYCHAVKLPWL